MLGGAKRGISPEGKRRTSQNEKQTCKDGTRSRGEVLMEEAQEGEGKQAWEGRLLLERSGVHPSAPLGLQVGGRDGVPGTGHGWGCRQGDKFGQSKF